MNQHLRQTRTHRLRRAAIGIATCFLLISPASAQIANSPPSSSAGTSSRYSIVNLSNIGGPHPHGRVSIASLNKSGQIAGYFNDIKGKTDQLTSQAFIWKNGNTTLLPPFTGFLYCSAFAQNDSGLVVGQSHNNFTDVKIGGKTVEEGGNTCACVWEHGRPRRLKMVGSGDSMK